MKQIKKATTSGRRQDSTAPTGRRKMATAIQLHTPRSLRSRSKTGAIARHVDTALKTLDRKWDFGERRSDLKECSCAECRAIRRRPFTCATCGFEGTPFVFPCDCVEQDRERRQYTLDTLRRLRRDPEFRAQLEAGFQKSNSLKPGETIIDRFESVAAWPATRKKCPTADPHCCHGCIDCPVCGCPSMERSDGVQVWHMVRTVRAELRALREILS